MILMLWTGQGAFIAFLSQIAAGLDNLATSLEAVIEAGSPETNPTKLSHPPFARTWVSPRGCLDHQGH
jgi:hypothetical protein